MEELGSLNYPLYRMLKELKEEEVKEMNTPPNETDSKHD